MKIKGQIRKVTMSDGQALDAWHVEAAGDRKGGVILIQEIFGLTTHIREQCQIYADAGFEVLAPALFDREAPGLQLSYSEADIERAISLVRGHPFDQSLADAQSCIDELAPNGKVFMVGYCYGGSVAFGAASRLRGLDAVSCYYGGMIPKLVNEVPNRSTIVHFGERDPEIPLVEVKPALDAIPSVTTFIYPAGHGFNSDRRADYHAPSAALARARTIELFRSA